MRHRWTPPAGSLSGRAVLERADGARVHVSGLVREPCGRVHGPPSWTDPAWQDACRREVTIRRRVLRWAESLLDRAGTAP